MQNSNVPQHFRFIIPIVDVLKELGGSGRSAEVTDTVIEKLNLPEEELSKTLKNGGSRIKNQIHWARLVLVKEECLDSSERGVWSLTEKGLKGSIKKEDLLLFYDKRKQWQKEYRDSTKQNKITPIRSNEKYEDLPKEDENILDSDFRIELLNILKNMPPNGFERICQRLLRESGFEQVAVTGKSSDGGIDGHGILQVNPFVSFRVLFQCKRYQGSVTPSQVRDFRGAMQGRADKGIIITTGLFTTEATKEARRDGVPPIELVDGEKLVEMFTLLELGLKPTKTYKIDHTFFKEYDR